MQRHGVDRRDSVTNPGLAKQEPETQRHRDQQSEGREANLLKLCWRRHLIGSA